MLAPERATQYQNGAIWNPSRPNWAARIKLGDGLDEAAISRRAQQVLGAAESLLSVRDIERHGRKLRVHVVSDGYDKAMNVQFPRASREEGVTYLVDKVTSAAGLPTTTPSGQRVPTRTATPAS